MTAKDICDPLLRALTTFGVALMFIYSIYFPWSEFVNGIRQRFYWDKAMGTVQQVGGFNPNNNQYLTTIMFRRTIQNGEKEEELVFETGLSGILVREVNASIAVRFDPSSKKTDVTAVALGNTTLPVVLGGLACSAEAILLLFCFLRCLRSRWEEKKRAEPDSLDGIEDH